MILIIPIVAAMGTAVGAAVGAAIAHSAGAKDRESSKYHKEVADKLDADYKKLQQKYNEYSDKSRKEMQALTEQHIKDEIEKDLLRIGINLQQYLLKLMVDIDEYPKQESLAAFKQAISQTNPVLANLNQNTIDVPKRYFDRNAKRSKIYQQLNVSYHLFQSTYFDPDKSKPFSKEEFNKLYFEDLGKQMCMAMLCIPAGEFLMGSSKDEVGRNDNEGPVHGEIVKDFFIGQFPVTQEQWENVMGFNPSEFINAKHPVERVTWHEAVDFCETLSKKTGRIYRLPTEVEWEYACRAGTSTPFSFGKYGSTDLLHFCGSNCNHSCEVGTFPPNIFGLHDMHGNVWEWCSDVWIANYVKRLSPSEIESSESFLSWNFGKRVIRGGSWKNKARLCRSAVRRGIRAFHSSSDIGFRVVCVNPGF